MQTFSAWLGRLALWLLLLGTVGMIAAMLVGVADVVGTEFFGRPVLGTLEFTESTMVLVVFGALAYAQERRAHIRVELLYSQVGPRGKSFMEAVTHIVAFVFFVLKTRPASNARARHSRVRRAASIRSFISRVACSMPTKRARATMLWPMFSS